MEQELKTKENGVVVTRAEKRDAVKGIIRELLQQKNYKAGELIDDAAKVYSQRFKGEETDNVNDVKGRVGSVLDVMKKENEVSFDEGIYALKGVSTVETANEVVEKKKNTATAKAKKTAKKTEEKQDGKAEETPAPVAEEKKPTKKRASKKKETTEEKTEKAETVATVETAVVEEKKPAKKRVSKKKATVENPPMQEQPIEEKQEEIKELQPPVESKAEEVPEEKVEEKATEKTPISTLPSVMDISFLLGGANGLKKAEKQGANKQEQPAEKEEKKENKPIKTQEKPQKTVVENALTVEKATQKSEEKKTAQNAKKQPTKRTETPKKTARTMTADERLKDAFLKKLHKLGGEYFEYYSVYLLEKYSRMNGRRLESLKVSAGDRDGGIDGEIEVTDRLGFRETIYIQAKNWDPSKGDEKLWVVGETLLQQFIGACVCRQAKDGKQHCRGIFITTSRFTPEAKRILEDTADKFVGYDGEDLYETAKECGFGIVKKNGEYVLDENLLSGEKAFFNMA